MVRSRESGPIGQDFSAEEDKKKPAVKVIKKNSLGIKLEDFNVVPKDQPIAQSGEKQSDQDWAEDLRAIAKLKQKERLTKEDQAREDIKKLFKE